MTKEEIKLIYDKITYAKNKDQEKSIWSEVEKLLQREVKLNHTDTVNSLLEILAELKNKIESVKIAA